jgi:hypothetical protein
LSPTQAGKLKVLLGFALMPVMWRFGRAATQPLTQRQHRDAGVRWSAPLKAMHVFFERTLPRLPALVVPMTASRQVPVLVYTDASFVMVRGRPVIWLGMYVFDPLTGAEVWARRAVPTAYFQYMEVGKKTYIIQGELIVAVAAYYSLPELLRGRAVMHFIDNMVALSAIVNGYASKPDCATMVNSLHEAVLELRVHLWAEWVPSKANIGDWPSRPALGHLVPKSAVRVPMVLPPLEEFAGMMDGE